MLKQFSLDLRRLLFSDILIRFCERIPFAWVVIYVMDYQRGTTTQVGLLTAIEMAAAIVWYIPASYLADRFGKEQFVIATFIFFTAFPVVLWLAHNFTLLVVAFAIRGLKEFGEPARKSLIISYAPSRTRGQVIGAYYLVRDTIVASGAFIGALFWSAGPAVNLVSPGVLGAAETLAYTVAVFHQSRGRSLGD